MNVEKIPLEVRDDIEDQSLGILEAVADHVVVIGGWAVRAVLGPVHGRFSLDVDAVAAPEDIERVRGILEGMGFEPLETDLGIRMFASYEPRVDVGHLDPGVLEGIELRVEVSGAGCTTLRPSTTTSSLPRRRRGGVCTTTARTERFR